MPPSLIAVCFLHFRVIVVAYASLSTWPLHTKSKAPHSCSSLFSCINLHCCLQHITAQASIIWPATQSFWWGVFLEEVRSLSGGVAAGEWVGPVESSGGRRRRTRVGAVWRRRCATMAGLAGFWRTMDVVRCTKSSIELRRAEVRWSPAGDRRQRQVRWIIDSSNFI